MVMVMGGGSEIGHMCAMRSRQRHHMQRDGQAKNGMFQQLLGTSNTSVAAKIASSPSEPTAIVIQDYGCVVYVM